MKKSIINLAIAGVMLFLASSICTSCKKDECKDVVCQNGGTCDGGNCKCTTGYESSDCSTKMSDKFIGSYKLNESCPSGSISDYAVTIAASTSTVNKILITGFGGLECAGQKLVVEATVNGKDLTVASQALCNNQVTVNSGSGSMNASNTTITVTYSYTFGSTTETCTGTYTKQ